MKAASILLVEDDHIIAANLQEQLEQQGYHITGHATNSDEAIRLFREDRPDIALLDIELNGSKLDGIELSIALHSISPLPILFLSSHGKREFVERAKQAPMVQYVLKSAPMEQLFIALDTAFATFYSRRPAIVTAVPALSGSSCALYATQDFFFVRQDHRHVRVEVADIRWVEAMEHAVKIVTDAKAIAFSVRLKSFLEQVPHPALMRTHRSWAVNTRHVVAYHRGRVMVRYREGVQEIPISDTYRDDFLDGMPGLKAD